MLPGICQRVKTKYKLDQFSQILKCHIYCVCPFLMMTSCVPRQIYSLIIWRQTSWNEISSRIIWTKALRNWGHWQKVDWEEELWGHQPLGSMAMQGGRKELNSLRSRNTKKSTTNVLTYIIWVDPKTFHRRKNLPVSFVNSSPTGFKIRWESQIEAKTYRQENQSKSEISGKVTNPVPCMPQAGTWRSSMKNCEKWESKCASSSKWNSNDLLILVSTNFV